MALPNFLIIGAQKSGTTWLAYRLRQHPDAWMPPREVHFFDNASNLAKGLAWYESHFAAASDRPAIGEKTPEYSWVGGRGPGHLPDVHRHIHAALPDVRLILILRNPVERAISHVNHLIRAGQLAPTERIDDLLVGRRRERVADIGVIDRGRYAHQIAAFRELFDARQMLVLVYEEDVVASPGDGLAKVSRFLGIASPGPVPASDRRRNSAARTRVSLVLDYYVPLLRAHSWRLDRWFKPWKGSPSESAMRELYRVYAEDNARLFELLGREAPPSWQPGWQPHEAEA